MTDADVVERFAEIVGCGYLIDQHFRTAHYKSQRCWYVGNRADVIYVLELLLPWFGERRRRRGENVLTLAMRTPFEGWDAPRTGELGADRH